MTISMKYTLKWRHKKYHHYQWSTCGKLFNVQSGREIKKVVNGGSVGYWIAGRFITLGKLRQQLVKIQYDRLPF